MKNALLLFAFGTVSACFAQQNQPSRFYIDRGATVTVSALPDDPWLSELKNLETKDHLGNPDKKFLYEQKRKSSELYPRRTVHHDKPKSTLAVNPPVLNSGFDGNTSNGSVPLDNYLAVSDSSQIVSVSNTRFAIYDAQTGANISTRSLNSFCLPLGLTGLNNGKFDPKVIYDPTADRFIAVILNASTAAYSKVIIAFSQTNDPDSTWNLYALPGNPFNDTTWFDYPSINITPTEVFITGNQVRQNVSWQLGFRQTVIWQIRKKEGYEGNTLVTDLWSNVEYAGKKIRNLHPVKWGPDIQGPNQYFLSNRNFAVQNDTIFLLEVTDTIGAPGAQLNVDVIIADKKYGVPPSVPQPGTNQYLATNDGRILSAIYRNGEIQFASNCMDTSSGRSAIYFGVIDGVDNQAYSLQSSLIANDTLEFGYPNMSWVGDGTSGSQTIITLEHSSEYRHPGLSAVFYADGEFSDMITVKEGAGILNLLSDSIERWGDYSGSQPVYNRNGEIWMCGTYATAANAYMTWIAQLDNPFGAETGVNDPEPKPEAIVFPNPGTSHTSIRFELPSFIHDFTVELIDMQGRKAGTLYRGEAAAGLNQLSFHTGHLASGTYFIQLRDGDKVLQTLKFIRE